MDWTKEICTECKERKKCLASLSHGFICYDCIKKINRKNEEKQDVIK